MASLIVGDQTMDETTTSSQTTASGLPAEASNPPSDETKSLSGTECSQPPGADSSGSGGDPDFEHRHRELAIRESRRWDADRLVERYEGFFHSFRARA